MISPRGTTVVQAKDRVVLFAAKEVIRQVEKMFAVQLEYF
jgi:trk system potassium uptake protein TrkA